jgi:hypothetical protein
LELSASCARELQEVAKGRGRTAARARDCVESPNAIVRALPVTHPQGQAADRRRHSDCPRAIGLHLGDQSRGHGTSTGLTGPGLWALPTSHSVRNRYQEGDSRKHRRAAVRAGPTAGEFPSGLCGRSSDRRPTLDRDSPRRTNGNAVPNPRIRDPMQAWRGGRKVLSPPGVKPTTSA